MPSPKAPEQNAFNIQRDQALEQFQKISEQLDQLVSEANQTKSQRDLDSLRARQEANLVERQPWVMSTTEWLAQSPPQAILWAANPESISWSLPQRSAVSKNLYGTVHHYWPDNFRGTFFDEPRISLSLQTGNMLPVVLKAGNGGYGSWIPSAGILNFYDFLNLVDAPKLTSDGRVNLVSIKYYSTLFPEMTIFGLFDPAGIRFSDSANSPNKVESWSADFIVHDTYPRLSSYGKNPSTGQSGDLRNDALKQMYQKAILDKGTGDKRFTDVTARMSFDVAFQRAVTAANTAKAKQNNPTTASLQNQQRVSDQIQATNIRNTVNQARARGVKI